MERFLGRKLAQTSGNILGGSSLQKPVSSYQIKLPELSSSFYSIADEPFPQVSGFLDDTVSPSFISKEASVLNSFSCTQSENKDKGVTSDSGLNCSFGVNGQSAGGSTSTKTLQNDKDIISATAGKTDADTAVSLQSSTFLEKSDLMSIDLKISSFNVSQDLKELSDPVINSTVDVQSINEKCSTFDFNQDVKEQCNTETNVTVDLPNLKEKNSTFDLTQDSKEQSIVSTVDLQNNKGKDSAIELSKKTPDICINVTVDLKNIENNSTFDLNQDSKKIPVASNNANVDLQSVKEKNSTFDLTPDSKEQSETASNATVDLQNTIDKNSTFDVGQDSKEQCDANVNATIDLHNVKEKNSTFESQEPKKSPGDRLNSTVDIVVPGIQTESGNATVDLVRSQDPKEGLDTRINATLDIPNVESVNSKPASPDINSAPLNTTTEQPQEKLEGTVDMQQQEKLDDSLNSEDDKMKNTEEANLKISVTVEEEQMSSAPLQESGDISRSSVFSLDDTLHMKTSFIFTSTPIVFGKESRFEILRDTKPTPRRKRLSVINSIEVHSNDELVGSSNHDGTEAMQATEGSGQKVSTNCTSSHSTSEPANKNKPLIKPPMKRQLPQLSSKLSHPKSSLPPRPQASINSSVPVKPKTVRGPQTLHPPNTLSTTQLGIRKTLQMNKGRNIAPVKNTVPASTVKQTSMVSSVTGYNFTAVAKPSSSGIPQVKPSGLQPPTRKRPALKMPQTTRPHAETIRTQPNNKPTALMGMRTRNSQPASVGQKRLSNEGLPSPKRKRIAPAAQCKVESDALHPAEGAHESGCGNCLQHKEKLERVLQELNVLRSECKNWGPLHDKLEKCVEEMKRL